MFMMKPIIYIYLLQKRLRIQYYSTLEMSSSQVFVSLPVYEGYLKIVIWHEPDSVSKASKISKIKKPFYLVFTGCQLLCFTVSRSHSESPANWSADNSPILSWSQICCSSWEWHQWCGGSRDSSKKTRISNLPWPLLSSHGFKGKFILFLWFYSFYIFHYCL